MAAQMNDGSHWAQQRNKRIKPDERGYFAYFAAPSRFARAGNENAEQELNSVEIAKIFTNYLMGSSLQRESRRRDGSSERLPADRLLTPTDIAEITGLSVETLAQWRSQRRGIHYLKISRNCVRYRQVDLDQWLASHIVHVETDPSNAMRRI
jgi:predicted DNA-binding transcriptional regulator AlpA